MSPEKYIAASFPKIEKLAKDGTKPPTHSKMLMQTDYHLSIDTTAKLKLKKD